VTAAAAIAAGIAAQGSLARESAFHLYYLAAAAQAVGRLTVASELATYGLTFKKGVVESAASTWPQDDLGEFLVRRGVVTAAQAADARELAARAGGDLLAALVELRLIDPAARFADLQAHGAGLVWRALATESGTWRWEPSPPSPAFAFPLGSRWGMLCDAVRRLDPGGVARRLGDRAGRPVSRVGGRVDPAELRLNAQEARAAALLDGGRTVEEAAGQQGLDADLVRRVALLLGETELLTFAASPRAPAPPPAQGPAPAPAPGTPAAVAAGGAAAGTASESGPAAAAPPAAGTGKVASSSPAGARPPTAAARPAPAVTPARPTPAVTPARPAPALTAEALRATLERFRDADHFQVLGVSPEADTPRIKTAYFQLARTYHPDASKDGESDEARKLRADIFARIGAAWAVLEDEARRASYKEELASGGAAEVDISVIFRSEEVFRTVEPLVRSRAYAQALERVNEAIALYADEPEYGVWKAWIEFLLAPEGQKKAQRMTSERAIEALLRKSPKCRPGWRFLGLMAKLAGDAAAAERHLKRGLAELPEDPELQLELRHLKK
jgi:DnaJ-domain-containing protein 1